MNSSNRCAFSDPGWFLVSGVLLCPRIPTPLLANVEFFVRTLLTIIVLTVGSGASSAMAEETISAQEQQAEYVRLSNQMAKLAARNAWSGVERTYLELLALGWDIGFDDHVSGAHAARDMGNITAVKRRLIAATEIREDDDITDWLFEIDGNYGRVNVAADKGKAELLAKVMPFSPDHRKAIEFAILQVAETGSYDGLLPAGDYSFGFGGTLLDLEVIPRVQSIRVDLRTQKFIKKQSRQAEKEAKQN